MKYLIFTGLAIFLTCISATISEIAGMILGDNKYHWWIGWIFTIGMASVFGTALLV